MDPDLPVPGGTVRILVGSGFTPADVLRGAGEGRLEGPGPFLEQSERSLVANRRHGIPTPYLDRLELVPDQGTPGLLLRLDEADLGQVLGREADLLLDAEAGELRLERTPLLDRTYFLWLDPSRRWVNDPQFRRWLGTVIDRQAMLRYLFENRGEPAYRLLEGSFDGPVWQPRTDLPFSTVSSPRMELAYDSGDPHAASIGARLKAAFEPRGVRIDLQPRGTHEFRASIDRGVAAAILVHRGVSGDPLLDLTDSLFELPGLPESVRQVLLDGARHESPDARVGAAGDAEARLLREARLLPLVRLHGWLAIRSDLRGARVGPGGVLSLEQAWWSP